MLLDEYDGPQDDAIRNIDQTITKKYMEKCWAIVTSTEGEELRAIREHMDGEAEVVGFDYDGYKRHPQKYLGKVKHKRVSISGIINFIYYYVGFQSNIEHC